MEYFLSGIYMENAMRTGLMLSLVLLLTSCFRESIPISYFNTGGFILEDTSRIANEYLQSFEDDGYPVYYLGPLKDTISIGSRYWLRREKRFKEYPEYCIFKYSKYNISIQVDTLFSACLAMEYLSEERLIDRYCDSNRYYHASMISIRNTSDTAISLGTSFSISHIHREMLNSRGQWIKVNEKLCEQWFCGTGQPNLYLMPGEVIISKIGHFSGEYAVSCRLALGRCRDTSQVYSNIFTECIDDRLLRIVEGS
ncbi:hypothetical protein SAMN04488121_105137 [Chitinophaga filiformis]|uniref:Uncharacterized protein n=2 Tax=Chitinophaga filiformis TaxID=104663 RepID=A0A1G7VIX0_CHIFI|nr:hypothetical protein SAMN04488121_105137 [Chitinophaga filiformis]